MTGLLFDEMYPPRLAAALRERGHDAVALLDVEVGLASRSDEEVLAWAARHGRCVVTENVNDFARIARTSSHAGVVLVPAKNFPRSGAGMARLVAVLDALLAGKGGPGADEVLWLRAEPR